jgi:tetratricopeptide (TPR) repeat protein
VCDADVDDEVRIAQQYCLQTRLLELGSMATVLASADAAAVEHATRGGNTLRSPGDCLYVVPAPTAAPLEAEQHLALRLEIAQARAHGDVGRLDTGLAVARKASAAARELGDRSLEAEALLVEAELVMPLLASSVVADPSATVHAAVLAAEAAHRADLIALATVTSLETEYARGDYGRARQLEPRARASAAALGDPPELVGRIDLCQAGLLDLDQDAAGADALLEHARDQFERSGPTSRRWLARTLNLLGEARFGRGAYAAARPYYERVLTIVREDLRDHHLLVADASGNLAETYFLVGDFDTAAALFSGALTTRREVFGDGSIWVTHTQGHLADCALELGDSEGARAWYAAALATRAMQAPVVSNAAVADVMRDLQSHLQTTWMHNGLALALVDLGRYDEAWVHAEQGDTTELPTDRHHPDLSARIDARGVVLLAMGRVDEAIAAFEHALARCSATYPADARPLAFALVGLGRARLAKGDVQGAIAPLQRALEIFAPTPRAYPRTQAAARFALGQAWQHDVVQRASGREQVRAAIALLGQAEGAGRAEREAMQAWLDS